MIDGWPFEGRTKKIGYAMRRGGDEGGGRRGEGREERESIGQDWWYHFCSFLTFRAPPGRAARRMPPGPAR